MFNAVQATVMAVHLLAPPPGSVVLDMCAAPGMKTTQLAAFMRNEVCKSKYSLLCVKGFILRA